MPPSGPAPPPDHSDHRVKKRNLSLEKSGRAIFGTQTFASQTSPLPPHSKTSGNLGIGAV